MIPVLAFVGVLMSVAVVLAPATVWRVTQGWQYKDPEANEPSDVAYMMSRIGGVIFFLFCIAAFIWSLTLPASP